MKKYAKEKLKRWLRVLLHTQDTPERTALAFAVGVYVPIQFSAPIFLGGICRWAVDSYLARQAAAEAGDVANDPEARAGSGPLHPSRRMWTPHRTWPPQLGNTFQQVLRGPARHLVGEDS